MLNVVKDVDEIQKVLGDFRSRVQSFRRYVEPLEPFLAVVLIEYCPVKVQGLKHKYPLAFSCLETLPYKNARVFTWGTLEQEYLSRVAYALLHYASKDAQLDAELKQLFKKEFPFLDQYCSQLEPGHAMTSREMLHLSRQIVKIEEASSPTAIVKAYAVVEYFIELYHLSYALTYECDEAQEELVGTVGFLQRTVQLLLLDYSVKGYNTTLERVDEKVLRRIKSEVRPYIQAYEKQLGMDLVKYLKEYLLMCPLSSKRVGYQVALYRQFAQDIQTLVTVYPMTSADFEQLFYVLLETARQEQGLTKHPDVASFCSYLDQYLIPAVFEYIHAKAYAMDRQYFFKTQGFADTQMVQALQKEVRMQQQRIEGLESICQRFDEERNQLKQLHLKQLNQQTKTANESLALANQEIRQLQKKLEHVQLELEAAKQREKELEEWTDLASDESSLEQKQARWIEQLNTPEILIVGCHPRTIHRLKRLLPDAKYYELDTTIQDQYLVGVKHIFICLHQVNHSMTFKLDRCCAEVPRYPIRKTNANLIIQELAEALGLD